MLNQRISESANERWSVILGGKAKYMSAQNTSTEQPATLVTTAVDLRQPRRYADRGILIQWVVASGLAVLIGRYALEMAYSTMDEDWTTALLLPILIDLLIGLALGLLQGSVLRAMGYRLTSWIWATGVGGALGGAMCLPAALVTIPLTSEITRALLGPQFYPSLRIFSIGDVIPIAVCGLVTGLLVGDMQSRVLQKGPASQVRWTLKSGLGWAVGCAVIPFLSRALLGTEIGFFFPAGNVIAISLIALVCGLIGGAITGYPLMRALQPPSIQNPQSEI